MNEFVEGMACRFETYASDQLAGRRWQSTAKAKRECELRAEIWQDAANELRSAFLESNK